MFEDYIVKVGPAGAVQLSQAVLDELKVSTDCNVKMRIEGDSIRVFR